MAQKTRTISLAEALRAVVEPGTRVSWERQHGTRHLCPVCEQDCMRTAVVDLAYTFEVCSCGGPIYDHLVEHLWHRNCFRTRDVREADEVTPEVPA